MDYLAAIIVLISASLGSHGNNYQWKITLMEQTSAEVFKESVLLKPLPLVNTSLILNGSSVLPFHGFKEKIKAGVKYEASSYMFEGIIIDENGQIANAVMRSVLLSGFHPLLHVNYPGDQHLIDSGSTLLDIQGAVKRKDTNQSGIEVPDISWIFPFPINSVSEKVYVEMDEINTGSITVAFLKKAYLVVESAYLNDGTLTLFPVGDPFIVSLHTDDDLVLIKDFLVLSHDEFESAAVKQLPPVTSTLTCSQVVRTAIQLSGKLLRLTEKGIFEISPSGSGGVISRTVTHKGTSLCPVYVSSLRIMHRTVVLISDEKELFVVKDRIPDSASDASLELVILQDLQNITVCQFLSLPPHHCRVVCHIFASQCCSVYAIVEDLNSFTYFIMEYSDFRTAGNWSLLARFPTRTSNGSFLIIGENYALIEQGGGNPTNPIPIILSGMSEMQISNGHLYIWGNMLLTFDKRSATVFAFLTQRPPNASITFDGHVIKQFAFERGRHEFSLLLSNGDIWHGVSKSTFDITRIVKNNRSIQNVTGNSLSNVFGLYYDSHKSLYGLAILGASLNRFLVDVNLKQSDRPAIWMTVTCGRAYAYASRRIYVFKPPRIWPGNNRFLNGTIRDYRNFTHFDYLSIPTYDEEQMVTYRSAACMVFINEKIGNSLWWLNHAEMKGTSWYFENDDLEEYLEYLSVNNLHLKSNWTSYISQRDYALQRNYNPLNCEIPSIVYLDKDETISFNISLSPSRWSPLLAIPQLTIFVSVSANDLIDHKVTQHIHPLQALFEVKFTGLALEQHPPGMMLQTVSATIWPWRPQEDEYTVPEAIDVLFKVGCPPAMSLQFDEAKSAEMLASRGRVENFDCLPITDDDIPCFTLSELATTFFIRDHVTGTKTPFTGNFTLKVVGGGVGHAGNIANFTNEEVAMYNYRPGESDGLQSLIWTAVSESDALNMKDEATGELVFDSRNPASIMLQCRIESPCGSIPIGTPNPSEYFLLIEISNKGVDSSTNCDFTMRFVIHLIGLELNPYSHFFIMLITLSILVLCVFIYYHMTDGDGRDVLKKLFPSNQLIDKKFGKDNSAQIYQMMRSKRNSGSFGAAKMPSHLQAGSKRAFALSQSIHLDSSGKSRSWLGDAAPRYSFDGNLSSAFLSGNTSESHERLVSRNTLKVDTASPIAKALAGRSEVGDSVKGEKEKQNL